MFKPDNVQNVAQVGALCAGNKDFALDWINDGVPCTVPDFADLRDDDISFMTSDSGWPAYRDFLASGYSQTRYFWPTAPSFRRTELEKIKKQFPDFTFLLYCGRGRFGEVWLVQDLSEQIVALKMISKTAFSQLQTEKDGLIAYRNKIRNFEHLVQIYHVGQTEDFFYYTMEAAYSISDEFYIPITLARLLEHCYFSPTDSADISCSILEGLEILHSSGLAHRDIKPENIILVDGRVKICDFSLVAEKTQKTVVGTKYFIPRDIMEVPTERVGTDCDLFATGKVLYSLLCNDGDIKGFPRVRREILRDKLARDLNLVLNKACAASYRDRYAGAPEFKQALLEAKSAPKKLFGRA